MRVNGKEGPDVRGNRVPAFYLALFAIAVLGLACAALGAVAGSRVALLTYVIGAGGAICAALVAGSRSR
jgi:hypothetical protein